jgi:phosphoribosylformylglycinamidine synthase
VTFASAELTEKSEKVSRPAVQIANPIEEEKLKRAIIEIRDLELASSITDLGGGGLSSALGETAKKFDCGATLDLDKIPLRNADLAPWEIYVSESQERMLLTVPVENLERVLGIFGREDVESTPIGKLTEDRILRIYYQCGKIAEMDIPFLFDPPRNVKNAESEASASKEPKFPEPSNLTGILCGLLSSPNIASKENVIRTYDHEVKGNTVLKPLQGRYGGPNDAAVLKPLEDSWKGIAISSGMNPRFGKIDSYWMAASAIDEAIRNNVAVGGRRIALLDNFTWGNPEKPERLGSLVRACKACYDFTKAFKTPFVSGKDSLYNESPLGPVTPTLLITALGIVPDIRSVVSMDIKSPNNLIYIAGQTYKELGGSEYYRLKGFLGSKVPRVRSTQARRIFNIVTKTIDLGLIKASHDLAEGGLAVAAAEMAFSGGHGMELDLRRIPSPALERNDLVLFSESNSRFLLEIPEKTRDDFDALAKGQECAEIGKVTKTSSLCIYGLNGEVVVDASIRDLMAAWKQTMSSEA